MLVLFHATQELCNAVATCQLFSLSQLHIQNKRKSPLHFCEYEAENNVVRLFWRVNIDDMGTYSKFPAKSKCILCHKIYESETKHNVIVFLGRLNTLVSHILHQLV